MTLDISALYMAGKMYRSNCLIEALVVAKRFGGAVRFTTHGSRGWWPHFIVVDYKGGTYVEFRGVRSGLNALQSLYFTGQLRRRTLASLDETIRRKKAQDP